MSGSSGQDWTPAGVSYFSVFLFLFLSVSVELQYTYFAQKTAKDMISSWLQPRLIFLFVVN